MSHKSTWVIALTLCAIVSSLLYVAPSMIPDRTPPLAAAASSLRSEPSADNQADSCKIDPGTDPFQDSGYCFVVGLIHPDTDLVRSREGECFTTVYKNALAALAFIHQGDIGKAERIFDFFQSKLATSFPGFHQEWNACSGQPVSSSKLWEGDNAFLLLALNYYFEATGSYGDYSDLANASKTG